MDSVSDESDTTNNCSAGVRVTVSRSTPSDDHGNTISDATSLTLDSSVSGRIETGNDIDYFRVRVDRSGELTVHTTGNLDTEGELQNSSGSRLASDSDDGSGDNFSIEYSVSAGTYYVKVESRSSNTGSYAIQASLASGGGDGSCVAGLVVNPGESCTYKGHDFTVSATGRGSILFFSAGEAIDTRGSTVNGVPWNFYATRNSGSNSWTVITAD